MAVLFLLEIFIKIVVFVVVVVVVVVVVARLSPKCEQWIRMN